MASPAAAWKRRLELFRVLLRRGRITPSEAARLTGTDRRKARADLDSLEEHGVPLLRSGDGRDTAREMPQSWRVLGADVGVADRLALSLGRELVASFLHDTDMADTLDALSDRITALDPQAARDQLTRRFHYIHEPAKDYSAHRLTVDAIVAALLGTHPVSFAYGAPNREPRPWRHVEPLTLIIYKRGLYLGFLHRNSLHSFALERMSAVVVHSDRTFSYPRPSEYRPQDHLAGRMGLFPEPDEPPQPVIIRFAPAIRPFIEPRRWTADQAVIPTADGGCDLQFCATGRELVSFVLQFGDKAEVLEPPWLRRAVADELRNAARQYARDVSPAGD